MTDPTSLGSTDKMGGDAQSGIRCIPARSRREALDHSLVLTSQGIGCRPIHASEGWSNQVAEADHDRAVEVLQKYHQENRGRRWPPRWRDGGRWFHSGVLPWLAFLALAFQLSTLVWPTLTGRGMMDSTAFSHGQWWRIFTAVTLHADVQHLLANLVTGFLLWGLAMAYLGAGFALLGSFCAAAFGNLAGWLLYSGAHRGLGASGMVTGALGLLVIQAVPQLRRDPSTPRLLFKSLGAALLLLVLIGFNPESDVIAHVGGFMAGLGIGLFLARMPGLLASTSANRFCLLLFIFLLAVTWTSALLAS